MMGRLFSRYERPKYSVKLQFQDIEEEYSPEFIKFPSGKNMLQGYLLGQENNKGLVVVVHGLGGSAENCLSQTLYFINRGYRVFTYDVTGYHLSEGKNSVGLPQAVGDLDAALTYIENEEQFSKLPVYLYGHSWGGYAETAILNFNHNITAVASVSGFSDPKQMICEWIKRVLGKWSVIVFPFVVLQQRLAFGKKLDITAVDGINKAGIPVLLVHGSKDTTVLADGSALIARKEEISNPKAKYLLMEKDKQNGHLDLLFTVDAMEYRMQMEKEQEQLLKNKNLTDKDMEAFFSGVDKTRSCVVNEELFGQIAEFFEASCYPWFHSCLQDVVDRVCQMEKYMDEVMEALQNAPEKIGEDNGLREKISILTNYMDSGQWLADYEADERGELPKELKRGVLSQDGLYNLICEIEENERTL